MRPSFLVTFVTLALLGPACSGGSSFSGSQPGDSTTGGEGTGDVGGASSGGSQGSNGGSPVGGGPDATGGNTASGTGYSSMTCEQLAAAYKTELATAKNCAGVATSDACSKQVQDSVACGCVTFINGSRSAAINNMQKISEAYKAAQCAAACPASACVAPTGASCSSSGTGSTNRCVDSTN